MYIALIFGNPPPLPPPPSMLFWDQCAMQGHEYWILQGEAGENFSFKEICGNMKKALFPSWSQQVLSNYYCVTIIIYRCNVVSPLNLLQFYLCRFVLFLICCLLMLSCICYNVAILITKCILIKVFKCMLDLTGG